MWYLLLLPLALGRSPRAPTVAVPLSDEVLEQRWLDVRLDHFMASNTERFPMRYFYNPTHATTNNVVIVLGGEWTIHEDPLRAGLPYDLAVELNAGLFYTEHRFYGQSRPGNDTSLDLLRYLTVDQALGDLVQFIDYVTSDSFEGGRYKGGTVSVAGCSYAGSLAAWLRLAYPHRVHSALSDSPLLLAKEDFSEYYEMVAAALEARGGAACVSSTEAAMTELLALVVTAAGAAQVSTMFNTCSSLTATNLMDRATFFAHILDIFGELAERAAPGDIEDACAALTDDSGASPAQRLADWLSSRGPACIETSYTELVNALTNVTYDDEEVAQKRLWKYQSCVQFGWYQTTSGDHHPFHDVVPIEYYHQMCKDIFGINFDEARLRSGIYRSNLLFGGLSHLADYVVSVVGDLDPWAAVGPNVTHATHKAPVFVLPEASHCKAMEYTDSTADPEVSRIKLQVLSQLVYQATGEPLQLSAAPRLAASALAVIVGAFLLA